MTVGRLPNESPAYAKLRDELHEAEIALRNQRERVAELRRRLPDDTPAEDYALCAADVAAGPVREVRLSQAFEDPAKTLVLMQFMYGGSQEEPCPMCTCWADAYDGAVPHLLQRVNFGVLVAGDLERFRSYGRERGWRHLRLFSSAGSSFKTDFGFETPDGAQLPGVSVFRRQANGDVRHFYSQCAYLGEAGFRGMDLLNPLWHFLDLTPEGRGDFFPSRTY